MEKNFSKRIPTRDKEYEAKKPRNILAILTSQWTAYASGRRSHRKIVVTHPDRRNEEQGCSQKYSSLPPGAVLKGQVLVLEVPDEE